MRNNIKIMMIFKAMSSNINMILKIKNAVLKILRLTIKNKQGNRIGNEEYIKTDRKNNEFNQL